MKPRLGFQQRVVHSVSSEPTGVFTFGKRYIVVNLQTTDKLGLLDRDRLLIVSAYKHVTHKCATSNNVPSECSRLLVSTPDARFVAIFVHRVIPHSAS